MAEQQIDVQPNDILAVLMDMRSGAVAADVNAKFNEMIRAVLDTGGKGELAIIIKAEPAKLGLGGAVLEIVTEHDCKMKKPELKVGKSMFFVTREGRLTREDPNQTQMFAPEPAQKERAH